MSQDDRNKLNRIEELKAKLFTKNYKVKSDHQTGFTHHKKLEVPDEWGDSKKPAEDTVLYKDKFFMKTSIFRNLFIGSFVFFLATVGYALYIFSAGGNSVSNDNIDISVLGNNFTAGGEPLSLVVGITNKNNSALDLVDLVMEYSKSSTNASGANDNPDPSLTETSRVSLGTIPAGAIRNENMKVTLFGEQGSITPIKFSIEYRVEGSNAIFVKDKSYNVTINSTPLNLAVDAPSTISPNQDMTLNIKATLNATVTAQKMMLKVDYPPGFTFGSATPTPSLGNNVWTLGDLPPGAERNISITGKMIDVVDGEQKTFHISSGTQSSSDKSTIDVVFNTLPYLVAIQKPFIEAKFFVNGVYKREYTTNTNAPITGEIRWANNLDTKVNDLVIQAKVSGNALNRRTINAQQGFYDSATDTITWDKNSKGDFGEVSPGDTGSVNFTVSPLSLFSASGGVLPDPTISISISISGKQLVSGYATTDLNNSENSTIKIISDVGFVTKALYYSGAFTNTGAIPPKVQKETTYTVVWSLSNTSNNISKASVSSSLPVWMRFVGTVSPATEDLKYNSSTRELTWNIGSIPKGTGITNATRTVSFQVGFSPSLSQVGTTPVIINDAVLTGHDDFANVDITVNKASLRTMLDADPAFPDLGGTVVE